VFGFKNSLKDKKNHNQVECYFCVKELVQLESILRQWTKHIQNWLWVQLLLIDT